MVKCRFLTFITILSFVVISNAQTTTVYDSSGFEGYTAGSINGQSGWGVANGGANVINIGGVNGKVLSFAANDPNSGSSDPISSLVNLTLNYTGNPANNPADGTVVKWSYDFYQYSLVDGAVFSYRTPEATCQAKILPQRGSFRVELRKDSIDSPFWPSTQIGTYQLGQWNHIEVYQFQPSSIADQLGTVRIFINGKEVTKNAKWYTWYAYWRGYIGSLQFAPVTQSGAKYYIDNLKIEEGPEITVPQTDPEVFTVYDSLGFEQYSAGTIDNQDSGKWLIDYATSLTAATVVTLPNDAKHSGRGKVLSFNNISGNPVANIYLQLAYTGDRDGFNPYVGTKIKWSYDFYQENTCWGAIYTYRNLGQVQQVKLLPEIGNFNAELRKGVEGAFWPSQKLGSYDVTPEAAQWHHVEVYQIQPYSSTDVVGQVRIWMDGEELTLGANWYTAWAYFVGYIDSIQFAPQVMAGAFYYVDNLKVEEGPDIAFPAAQCGSWGYAPGDLDRDCYVGIGDLYMFVQSWLGNTDINDPAAKPMR